MVPCEQYLLNLLVQSSDVAVLFRWSLVHFHCLHTRIIPSRTNIKISIKLLIKLILLTVIYNKTDNE